MSGATSRHWDTEKTSLSSGSLISHGRYPDTLRGKKSQRRKERRKERMNRECLIGIGKALIILNALTLRYLYANFIT
jgi:hypothetical protein